MAILRIIVLALAVAACSGKVKTSGQGAPGAGGAGPTFAIADVSRADGESVAVSWSEVGVEGVRFRVVVARDAACQDPLVAIEDLEGRTATVRAYFEFEVFVCVYASIGGQEYPAENNGWAVAPGAAGGEAEGGASTGGTAAGGATTGGGTTGSSNDGGTTDGGTNDGGTNDGGASDSGTPAPATLTLSFDSAAGLAFDAARVVVDGGAARLARSDRIDDADAPVGFAGGSFTGASWTAGALTPTYDAADVRMPDGGGAGGWLDMTGNVALYHIDEGVLDSYGTADFGDTSGHDRHATSTSSHFDLVGLIGYGITYEPGQHLSMPTANATGVAPTEESFVFWLNATQPIGETTIFESSDTPGHSSPERLLALTPERRLRVMPCDAGYSPATTTALPFNSWTLVVWTRSGAVNKIYVNGKLEVTANITATCALKQSFLRWGAGGYFDEVAIFSRVLADAEIATIYDRQRHGLSARFRSRVLDASAVAPWSTLSWLSPEPFGKSLPAAGQAESGWAAAGANADMQGNVLLLRFDDPAWVGAGDVRDDSGQGMHGTAVGAAQAPGRVGMNGKAANFDDTSYVTLPADDALRLGSRFTLSAWIHLDNRAGHQPIFQRGLNGDRTHFYIENGYLTVGSYKAGVATYAYATSHRMWEIERRWHHVAAVVDDTQTGAARIRMFVDGEEASRTVTWNDGFGSSDTAAYVGRIQDAGQGWIYARGQIDELAAWTRPLSAGEIAAIHRRGAASIGFHVRSCADAACVGGGGFVGPDGTKGSYYVLDPATLTPGGAVTLDPTALGIVPDRRWFQYEAVFAGGAVAGTPSLSRVEVGPERFDPGSPAIALQAPVAFERLRGFAATVGGTGSVRFQLSNDGGATWMYLNGGVWSAAASEADASTAAAIDAAAATFPKGSGSLSLRAILISDGGEQPELGEVVVAYDE